MTDSSYLEPVADGGLGLYEAGGGVAMRDDEYGHKRRKSFQRDLFD